MIPGVNPKQMQKMMKQMGMKQDAVPATRVEVFLQDGTKMVFDSPDLQKVVMMGQTTYQLSGSSTIESIDTTPDISDEDVQTVVEQTGVSEEKARQAIEDADGDLADAILQLSE